MTRRATTDSAAVAIASVDSPLGPLWLAMRGAEAVAIGWDDEDALRSELAERGFDELRADPAGVAPLRDALQAYFAGREPTLPPICRQGLTPFTHEVLTALTAVRRGGTTSYGRLAARTGRPIGASRAIGGAVGRNPLPILWPCHRVLQGDGSLGGFTGGLPRKRWLLQFESITWREPARASATEGVNP